MILFVFEGKDDNSIMGTVKALYSEAIAENVVCTYNNNIHQLYTKMKSDDGDPDFTESLLSVLQRRIGKNVCSDSEKIIASANEDTFSQIFLFFDYEPQHHEKGKAVDLPKLNQQLTEMLDFFDDETGNGKLYVSYPMVEALFYTKKLPDPDFYTYSIELDKSKGFKNQCHEFSCYGNNDFLLYSRRELEDESSRRVEVAENWNSVNKQNIAKANYICTGVNAWPTLKDDVQQKNIFFGQLEKYVSIGQVSVLSAYPMFLLEYLRDDYLASCR